MYIIGRISTLPAIATGRTDIAGTGFEPCPRQAEATKPGGWGLFLVEKLSDRWGVARNQLTRVWFEIDLSRPRTV